MLDHPKLQAVSNLLFFPFFFFLKADDDKDLLPKLCHVPQYSSTLPVGFVGVG